jgi:hypothetical protein
MKNEKNFDFIAGQGPINLEATVEGQNLNDLIIVDLFCLQIIESINPFRFIISGRDIVVSTSKTFLEDIKRELPVFLKALGVIKVCQFYVHKTKPTDYAYSLDTQKPVPFLSSPHRKNKVEKTEIDETSGGKSKNKKSFFSKIVETIGIPIGIVCYLGESFLKSFKKE